MISKLHFCLYALVLALATGCGKQGGSAAADPRVDYYTCDMHPSVHSHDPKAKCPICSMDLEPVYKKGLKPGDATKTAENAASSEPHDFTVPVERQQQIGVTFAEVKKMPLERTIRAAGTVASDMTRSWEYVARVDGYVQKLNVTSPGEPVKKDQALLSIYSPDLLISERELISQLNARDREPSADAKARGATLIEASRRRLEQWNVTAQQIDELEKSRQLSEFLTLRSPFDGLVEDVPVQQGRRVMPGDHLVKVVDLSVVWVWAEFYEDELQQLKRGEKVIVTSPAYPGESFRGEIALVSPFVAEMRRTLKARLDIPNPDFKLRPGMYVNAELTIHRGPGLSIPVSAIMPTGERTLVFVDKGEGKLEPRSIRTSGKYGDFYEVIDGLKEGERIVSSANFLIDAESKVQGAVKSFEEPAKQEVRP
jgi:Cu(I)/Ag(I) efflux system membrane fusion protein